MLKKQIRVLGIDDAPFQKGVSRETTVFGVIFRGGDFLDGVLSQKVQVDGNEATDVVIEMINQSKFKSQLRAILLDGIAVAGFNIVDIKKLYKNTKIPVIVVMRKYPDIKKIKETLKKIGMKEKISLLDAAGKIYHYNNICYQICGLKRKKAEEILKITSTHSYIPEAIRVAHLIGSALVFGESKGNAQCVEKFDF